MLMMRMRRETFSLSLAFVLELAEGEPARLVPSELAKATLRMSVLQVQHLSSLHRMHYGHIVQVDWFIIFRLT